jgi:uncharacterized protein YutE (UPF0331/DUF86 family)
MDKAYLHAMRQHLETCKADLQQLYEANATGTMSRFHTKAAERTLQVLIEACIGLAKRWVKLATQRVPINAYQAFSDLAQIKDGLNLQQWKAIVGMRNVLIHDYLQVDPEIIIQLIEEKRYMLLFEFADEALAVLDNNEHLKPE